MFSKFSRSLVKTSFRPSAPFSGFNVKGALLEVFNRQDLSSSHYRAATHSPLKPLEGHKVQYRQDQSPNYETTKLKNGITVLTESQVFPGVVDMGILLDVGTRDETHETSGALNSIKQTYYKTVLNTNETINYGMVQMSGGQFSMDYDQENAYFKASCLQHDVIDIFNMVADCALEPRSVVAANAAMTKIAYEHELEAYLRTGQTFNDSLLRTAFGSHGLGMPLAGSHHNYKYLSAHVLQKFQLENINPERIFVVAAGVENHQEFVELVESKLSFIPAVQGNAHSREASHYQGGEHRVQTEDNDITIGLAFRSAPWNSQDIFSLQVLSALIGSTSSPNGGAGTPGRIQQNLNKHNWVDAVRPINFNFSDAGLFGVSVTGAASNATDVLNATVSELKGLTSNISSDELNRAKAVAKANILTALERQTDRLEESAKNLKSFGKVVHQHYAAQIEAVTSSQINSVVAAVLSSRPTLVAEGGEVNRLPSLDKIESLVKP